ncbi:MAG: serine/threonine-protein kinase [Pyrinomonadaceae bacterium]
MNFDERIQRLSMQWTATPIAKLGAGGMGEVYLLRRDDTGEQLALKVMLPALAANPADQAMFLREAENCLALRHPNVVRAYEAGFGEGIFFLTMEFCEGGSLDRLVERDSVRPADEALAVTFDVLSGLQYAHTAEIPNVLLADGSMARGTGLVHRDLKPQNIFLSHTHSSRSAKVADFGLAKAFELAGLTDKTRTGEIAGTPTFMPRQQVLNFKYSEPEVDVWATAASMYFLLTGFTPRDFFPGRDPWRTVWETDPVPILKRGVPVPPRLAEVIDEALVDRPEIKFKEVAQFRAALEQAL